MQTAVRLVELTWFLCSCVASEMEEEVPQEFK